jgi:DNA-binding CsgD family transcriptional regulator
LEERFEKDFLMKNILTEREQNVLFYVSQGLINSEIAEKMHISVHTVKAHLEAIYDKFGVKNRVQAVMKAVVLGLIDINCLI